MISGASALIAGLGTWPTRRGWTTTLAMGSVFALTGAALGAWDGWLTLTPLTNLIAWAALLVITLLVPALSEEIVFRGVLYHPGGQSTTSRTLREVLPLSLFIAWHPLQWFAQVPWAKPVFVAPSFLICVGVLGLLCQLLRRETGSLWPPVALHWAAVVTWKGVLGG